MLRKNERAVTMLGWEVAALKEGRKTEVRIPLRMPKDGRGGHGDVKVGASGDVALVGYPEYVAAASGSVGEVRCPLGEVGSKFTVKEDWIDFPISKGEEGFIDYATPRNRFEYRADFEEAYHGWERQGEGRILRVEKWNHRKDMPLDAARFELTIVQLRLERFCDIGDEGAKAEGVTKEMTDETYVGYLPAWLRARYSYTYANELANMHGKQTSEAFWLQNRFAWVVAFTTKRIK